MTNAIRAALYWLLLTLPALSGRAADIQISRAGMPNVSGVT